MPKIESEKGDSALDSDGKDLFEGELEDALCVFKSAGANSDILKENEAQILFYVDLDNEEIIDRDKKKKAEVDEDDEIKGEVQPMLFNQYPLCKDHSLFLLFAEEGLPQVLSDELMVLVLQLFKISNDPRLRIGYNSMGADCIINNLHFHVLKTNSLFGDSVEQFPIETADKQLFFKTDLKHKSESEINMFNCGVRFGEVQGWPVQTLIISPDFRDDQEISLEDAQESLAHATGVVINHLIDANIPHNMLVADEGMTVYLIPRKFDMLIENVQFFTSFESLCGMIKYKNEIAFKTSSAALVSEQLATQVSYSRDEFRQLKQSLVSKFMSEYTCEIIASDVEELAQKTAKLKM